MKAQILEFDTNLAGFKVAKIYASRLSKSALSDLLAELEHQDVRLVYWLADSDDCASNQAAMNKHGFLASQHVTYLIDLLSLDLDKLVEKEPSLRALFAKHSTNIFGLPHFIKSIKPAMTALCNNEIEQSPIELYQDHEVSPELEQLALAAGSYSHFRMDPEFPRGLFFKIYHEWIKNSVNKSIACDIITIKDQDKTVAMTTLGTKNNRGDIGLLAVDANFRGKNFGTKIVVAAQLYFISQGFTLAQVVTQVANTPARRLYEKCGFRPEKFENFYHFWL